MSKQYRNVCFTSYYIDERLLKDNLKVKEIAEKIQYIIYQWETCPNTGKDHAQGYMELKNKTSMKFIKESILGDNSVHLSERYSTSENAINYCKKLKSKKEGLEPFEWGTPHKQGERNDIKQAINLIKEGKTMYDIASQCSETYIKYNKGLEKLQNILKPKKIEEKTIILCLGEPGMGKTEYAYENHPIEKIFKKPPGQWWDGYAGEEVVIIDDITTDEYKLNEFLQWLDKYPTMIPIKGSIIPLDAKYIYLTSNLPIEEWFKGIKPIHIEALKRRIEKTFHFTYDENKSIKKSLLKKLKQMEELDEGFAKIEEQPIIIN